MDRIECFMVFCHAAGSSRGRERMGKWSDEVEGREEVCRQVFCSFIFEISLPHNNVR
jgi:hypothetical protein